MGFHLCLVAPHLAVTNLSISAFAGWPSCIETVFPGRLFVLNQDRMTYTSGKIVKKDIQAIVIIVRILTSSDREKCQAAANSISVEVPGR